MTTTVKEKKDLTRKCAQNIVQNIEKSILKHRCNSQVVHKLAVMNEYIQKKYILKYEPIMQRKA